MSILREIKQYQKNCPFRRAIVDAIAEHKCCAINDKLDALLGKLEEAELLSRGKPNE